MGTRTSLVAAIAVAVALGAAGRLPDPAPAPATHLAGAQTAVRGEQAARSTEDVRYDDQQLTLLASYPALDDPGFSRACLATSADGGARKNLPASSRLNPAIHIASSQAEIRSARLTVARRWATTTVVRPSARRLTAAWTSDSDSASSALVASSSSRTGASRRIARAMATRWR